jgi:hypothetical protein
LAVLLSVALTLSMASLAFGDFVVEAKVLGVGRIQAVAPAPQVSASTSTNTSENSTEVVAESPASVLDSEPEVVITVAPIEREVAVPVVVVDYEPEPDSAAAAAIAGEAATNPESPDYEAIAIANIISRESGGNPYAENGIYKGIGQLSENKYPIYVGKTWAECIGDYDIQYAAMAGYISDRYGTAQSAWAHWQAFHWY